MTRRMSQGMGRGTSLAILGGITLVAAGARVFRLTRWSFADNELFTLRDTLLVSPDRLLVNAKPLLFILNRYLIGWWLPLDELGLRLLPLLFGIAAVPLLYVLVSRASSRGVGLFAATLVALNPWHVYWSQNARYHSLVFLLATIFAFALFFAARERSWKWAAGAVVAGGLGILAHPAAGLVVAGGAVWLVLRFGLRLVRGESVSRFGLAAAGSFGLVFLAVVVYRFVPQLVAWNELGEPWGYAGPTLVMSFGNWLTPGVVLFGAAGVAWLWLAERRELAVLVASCALVPMLGLALLGYFVPVSVGYLFGASSFVLVGAGYFLHRLVGMARRPMPRFLVGTVPVLALLAGGAPQLLSHYMDGSRADFRRAAEVVEENAGAGDVVLGDETVPLNYYLDEGLSADGLARDPDTLRSRLSEVLRGEPPPGRLWIVAWMRERGGFNELGLGPARDWIWKNCVLAADVSHPRLDYKRNDLHVYRCGPAADASALR